MRDFISKLESRDELIRIKKEIDPLHEVAAVIFKLEKEKSVLFENIKNHSIPIVGNLLNSRKKIAIGLEVDEADILKKCVHGIDNPIAPDLVKDGPCKELIYNQGIDLMQQLPVPTLFERDLFPSISAGLVITKDPETGIRNTAIIRFRVAGKDWGIIGFAPTHQTIRHLRKCEKSGKKLEIAIAIGNHPALVIASNFYATMGCDELALAGGILGHPVPLVKCETIDVEVPAASEIVLEGEVEPGKFFDEGPFGEYTGLYVHYPPLPVLRIKAMTCRNNPIFQTVMSGLHLEHILIGGTGIEATLFCTVRTAVPCVAAVCVGAGGCGRHHAVIALKSPVKGEGMRAAFAAFSHYDILKKVIIVDSDIDVHDPIHVDWAVSTRSKAEKDLVVLPYVKGGRSDPMVVSGLISKVIVIALKDTSASPESFEMALPPLKIREKIDMAWRKYID